MSADSPQAGKPIVILGAGGHGTSVASVAIASGYRLACFVDPGKAGTQSLGVPVIAQPEELAAPEDFAWAIAVGDNALRERILGRLPERVRAQPFPALVHPSAVICVQARIGEGTVVMPGAVVGPCTSVGRFCIVNTCASIDHDCVIDDFASVAPGAVMGGTVRIGKRTAISIGAVVKDILTIGDDVVVGANSFVNKPLEGGVVAYGLPARVVRRR